MSWSARLSSAHCANTAQLLVGSWHDFGQRQPDTMACSAQKRPCISQASSTDKTAPGMAPVILPCHHLCVDGIGTGGPLILLRK